VDNQRRFESVYSKKVRAGKRRTYFFDVRRTKGDDFYLTLTESTKKFHGNGYERHKIFLYKEDFNRFMESLEDVVNHVKTELMPDYDYDEYTRRHEEWEAKRAEMEANGEFESRTNNDNTENAEASEVEAPVEKAADETTEEASVETEDDMAW
jgi:hypothetical protein